MSSDSIYQVKLPKIGESVVSAVVIKWLKSVGEAVAAEEALLEVFTDKVSIEIPAPTSGILLNIEVQEGQEVDVGGVLCSLNIKSMGESSAIVGEKLSSAIAEPMESVAQLSAENKNNFISQSVLRTAKEYNISLNEVSNIIGTGSEGRVTKQDVEVYAKNKSKKCSVNCGGDFHTTDTIEELSFGRKRIIENLENSYKNIPQTSMTFDVNVTEVMSIIKSKKESFFLEQGEKLTITAYIVYAFMKSLKDYPYLNSFLENNKIHIKKNVNIGIAVDVKDSGVLIPVIKSEQATTLTEVAKEIGLLAKKARDKTLGIESAVGGTATVTNFGITGARIGVPILKYPEASILGVGAVHKKLGVNNNNDIQIQDNVCLTLTFDHRIVDGLYAGGMMKKLRDLLENDAKTWLK